MSQLAKSLAQLAKEKKKQLNKDHPMLPAVPAMLTRSLPADKKQKTETEQDTDCPSEDDNIDFNSDCESAVGSEAELDAIAEINQVFQIVEKFQGTNS